MTQTPNTKDSAKDDAFDQTLSALLREPGDDDVAELSRAVLGRIAETEPVGELDRDGGGFLVGRAHAFVGLVEA